MTNPTDTKLVNVFRCEAGDCGSPVFYDWGLKVMNRYTGSNPTGPSEKFANYASSENVQICARCNTPYIIVEGSLVDISADLGSEDVKAIIARGQATLPHPQRKDP